METCPFCKQPGFNHAPDGRCDACAEEYGCRCGCFPSPFLQVISEHDITGRSFHKDDDGRWSVTFMRPSGEVATVED